MEGNDDSMEGLPDISRLSLTTPDDAPQLHTEQSAPQPCAPIPEQSPVSGASQIPEQSPTSGVSQNPEQLPIHGVPQIPGYLPISAPTTIQRPPQFHGSMQFQGAPQFQGPRQFSGTPQCQRPLQFPGALQLHGLSQHVGSFQQPRPQQSVPSQYQGFSLQQGPGTFQLQSPSQQQGPSNPIESGAIGGAPTPNLSAISSSRGPPPISLNDIVMFVPEHYAYIISFYNNVYNDVDQKVQIYREATGQTESLINSCQLTVGSLAQDQRNHIYHTLHQLNNASLELNAHANEAARSMDLCMNIAGRINLVYQEAAVSLMNFSASKEAEAASLFRTLYTHLERLSSFMENCKNKLDLYQKIQFYIRNNF